MSYAILAACLWAVLAICLTGLRRLGSARIYALIALGVPITGWVVMSHGPWIGLLVLALGAALLRWPLSALWSSFAGRPAVRSLGAGE